MARDTRGPRKNTPGPGRPAPRRTRTTTARAPQAAAKPAAAPRRNPPQRWQSRVKLTRRAVALGVVIVALLISFVGTFQIYLNQQRDLAEAEQEIRDRSAQIADLQAELDRWNDPAYVKAQARERLGWVMPGETGYRLVDDDGKPIGGGVTLQSQQRPVAGEDDQSWWQKLAGSVATADSPVRRVASR